MAEFANPTHWAIFGPAVEQRRTNLRLPLNRFIERNTTDVWCSHLGFERAGSVDGMDARWGGAAEIEVSVNRAQGTSRPDSRWTACLAVV